ncbi:MAG: hypothetical protein P8P48_02835 [Saprospiraceae bacterium]|nr:hypothetical protein [Saprospiraceae bacterium]
MKSSIKNQIESPSMMGTVASNRSKGADIVIALAVFISCCLISFTESKEVVESLFTNIMP